MKIAFATQDNESVNAHFGWAKSIVVYDVSPKGHQFVQSFEFGDTLEEDGDEDKLAPKLEAQRCHRVLSRTSRNQKGKNLTPRSCARFLDVQPIYVLANVLGLTKKKFVTHWVQRHFAYGEIVARIILTHQNSSQEMRRLNFLETRHFPRQAGKMRFA